MSMLSHAKFRSAGVGVAMLAGIFFASSTGAQEQNSESPERDDSSIRMTLPNLTTHPLAGGTVMQRLCAEDGMGEKSCENVEVFIAPPTLENPIGEILHGLRRDLAVNDLSAAPDVIVSIQEVLDTQSENFTNPQSLSRLSEIQQDLETGVETQDLSILDKAVQDLWRLILQLEEDLRSEAEKALDEAREALKEALEKGASEEELKELREQAKEALEKFLEEQLKKSEDGKMSPEEKAAMEEMKKMMEKMQKMMEEMKLSEEQMAKMMEEMMKQAQEAQKGQSGQQGKQQKMDYQKMLEQMKQQMQQMQKMQQMQQNMDELKKLIEEQQKVRDDTFSDALENESTNQQEQKNPDEPANTKQQAPNQDSGEKSQEQQDQNGLAQQQKALSERLEDLMDKMRKEGADPGELQQAKDAMRRAEQDLNRDDEGQAVPDQDDALESMNSAQQKMQKKMQQMMQQMMPGAGPKSGQGPGGPAMSRPQGVPGVDKDGRISESHNPNDILDVSPGEGGEAQKGVRDQIRDRMEQGGNEYLENLLEGDQAPLGPA